MRCVWRCRRVQCEAPRWWFDVDDVTYDLERADGVRRGELSLLDKARLATAKRTADADKKPKSK